MRPKDDDIGADPVGEKVDRVRWFAGDDVVAASSIARPVLRSVACNSVTVPLSSPELETCTTCRAAPAASATISAVRKAPEPVSSRSIAINTVFNRSRRMSTRCARRLHAARKRISTDETMTPSFGPLFRHSDCARAPAQT
jgi:hypothetical protein